jgi:hypothetical protein
VEGQAQPAELVAISALRPWTCTECGGTGELLVLEGEGPLCLPCADLGHLVFLPAGDTALTRRARRASSLSAVVVRFSRARRRYERQGVLVERAAIEAAERECLADAEARERRRQRDRERRAAEDDALFEAFAAEILRLFPACPPMRARAIAHHAAVRGSGRVGRSAAGRAADATAVELAVIASVRHEETEYDALLMRDLDRATARARVRADVEGVLDRWRGVSPAKLGG